jgi:hypothetical protein
MNRLTNEQLAALEHQERERHGGPNLRIIDLIEEVRELRKFKPKKIGHFEICRVMAERGMDIRLSTLDNISNMEIGGRGKKNKYTRVTIGIVGDVLNPIYRGQFVGGFLICDKDQYSSVKKELEEQLAKS